MDTDTGLVYEAKKQMQLNMFIQQNLIKRGGFDLEMTPNGSNRPDFSCK